jgi:hypothetical protein
VMAQHNEQDSSDVQAAKNEQQWANDWLAYAADIA